MRWLPILFLALSQGALGETLSGTVVSVVDGDTLTIQDARKRRHKVRLAEIDAPERQQAFYAKSGQALHRLCFKKAAQVEWQAKDENQRYVGQVTCAGIDANAEQVRRGMAWVSPKFTKPGSPLYELETHARLRGIGLWADSRAVPPWDWRTRKQAR